MIVNAMVVDLFSNSVMTYFNFRVSREALSYNVGSFSTVSKTKPKCFDVRFPQLPMLYVRYSVKLKILPIL